jgi:hypothetical protein
LIERVVVEVLREGQWSFAGDFSLGQEEKAKELGRQLWRQGAGGIRISRFQREVILEHRRQKNLL